MWLIDGNFEWWRAAMLGLVLCSACSSKHPEDGGGSFEGEWEMTDERSVYDCGDGEMKSMLSDPPLAIRLKVRGSNLDLLELDQKDRDKVVCTYEYDLNGSHAVLAGTQSCVYSTSMTITWPKDELVVQGDSLTDRGEWYNSDMCSGRSDATYTRL